jgi:hypothetical protein
VDLVVNDNVLHLPIAMATIATGWVSVSFGVGAAVTAGDNAISLLLLRHVPSIQSCHYMTCHYMN